MYEKIQDKKEFDYFNNLIAIDFETSSFPEDYPITLNINNPKKDRNVNNKKNKKYTRKKSEFDKIDSKQERRTMVYACGILHQGEMTTVFGKDALRESIEFIRANGKGKTITAYNSRFDYYYILNELKSQGVYIHNELESNGRILELSFSDSKDTNKQDWTKIWDPCLFMGKSLKEAAKSLCVKTQKGDFDHKKMISWSDVDKYYGEVKEYLIKDVECVYQNFIKN